MSITALSAGRDQVLLTTRNAILRQLGCIVVSASTTHELNRRFLDGDYDVIILCHSVPADEVRHLVAMSHIYRPQTPVVFITAGNTFQVPDGLVAIDNNPHALVETLTSLFPTLTSGGSASGASGQRPGPG